MTSQTLLVTPDTARKRLYIQLTRIEPFAIDDFDWNCKKWRIRFQSWPRKSQEGEPILDVLLEVFPEDHPEYNEPALLPRNASLIELGMRSPSYTRQPPSKIGEAGTSSESVRGRGLVRF